MDSISISKSNTEQAVSRIISDVETYIMKASKASGEEIIGAARFSTGDFIESLKEDVAEEVKMMAAVGELLIATAEYIRSAATAFADVDNAYNISKVE